MRSLVVLENISLNLEASILKCIRHRCIFFQRLGESSSHDLDLWIQHIQAIPTDSAFEYNVNFKRWTLTFKIPIDPTIYDVKTPSTMTNKGWKYMHSDRNIIQPRSIHTKDSKMILDTSLLNTQHYKVHIKGKLEKSRQKSSALSYTSV